MLSMRSILSCWYGRCCVCVTMYNKVTKSSLCAVALTGVLSGVVSAGDFADPIETTKPEVSLPKVSSGLDFVKFSLDARFRYEFRDQQGADASHAGTFRFRPGLTFFGDKPLSFFVEGEHTFAAIRDFQTGTPQSANFSPFVAGNTAIADPETQELNRAFVKYSSNGFTAKVGRQRIILDNAAFVGNVGWRQNEQTFDAVSLNYVKDGLNLFYAYSNRVNRIFGTDGDGLVSAFEGDVHLLNGSIKQGDNKYGGYAYFIDFDRGAIVSNNTYGAYADLKTSYGSFHLEGAYQTEAAESPLDYDAYYGHVNFVKKAGSVTYTAGLEYLGDDFRTPLATVHAFNGFADAFILERLGLTNNLDGISDFYVRAATKVNGVVLKGALHHFRDESFGDSYGWEADLVAVKALNENTKALAKFAYFFGDNDGPVSNDIKQFSVQLDYKF